MSSYGCARWIAPHRTWRGGDAGVHAGGHPGDCQRRSAARSGRRSGCQNHPGEYLSLISAPWPRLDPQSRRIAQVHGVAARSAHRFRRLSSVQPERSSESHRRGRIVSLASGWRCPPVYARIHGRCAVGSGQRHHDGAGRMPGISRESRGRGSGHAAHGGLGAVRLPALFAPQRRNRIYGGAFPNRARLHVRRSAHRLRLGTSANWMLPGTLSVDYPWASRGR